MAAEPRNPVYLFPDLPRAQPAVDASGNFTPLWSLGLSSLFQALQQNYRNEGIMFPRLSAQNIADIEALYVPYIGTQLPIGFFDASGMTVYDTDNTVSKQFVITYDASTPPNIVTAAWRTFQFV